MLEEHGTGKYGGPYSATTAGVQRCKSNCEPAIGGASKLNSPNIFPKLAVSNLKKAASVPWADQENGDTQPTSLRSQPNETINDVGQVALDDSTAQTPFKQQPATKERRTTQPPVPPPGAANVTSAPISSSPLINEVNACNLVSRLIGLWG